MDHLPIYVEQKLTVPWLRDRIHFNAGVSGVMHFNAEVSGVMHFTAGVSGESCTLMLE